MIPSEEKPSEIFKKLFLKGSPEEVEAQMRRLAFETDSTRIVALMLDSVNSPAITIGDETMSDGYHAISHHGKRPDILRQHEKADRLHRTSSSVSFRRFGRKYLVGM